MSKHAPENQLLATLPAAERKRLLLVSEPVDLEFGDLLCAPGQDYASVYFPVTGIISLVASVHGHPPLEMGLIGREGMLGASLVLGMDAVPLRAVVQGDGAALRIDAAQFRRCLPGCPVLCHRLQRYVYVLMAQLSQSVACTRFHEVDERLARWLLAMHDRTAGEPLHLTHQFLADMLGVRRSAVTIAAGGLQDRGVIAYRRGEIHVLDRPALEQAACECYAEVERDYAAQFG
ncbi:Crp/Fnr family transcriptional regulator [Arenimonas sp. MALMAid1274]|uniref:Crp/Fnr family transcriptional regulator n=1 Tax=Arenimonas sp. MALMAid1274 TaxID=3411630 RepID=UPI003B9E9A42